MQELIRPTSHLVRLVILLGTVGCNPSSLDSDGQRAAGTTGSLVSAPPGNPDTGVLEDGAVRILQWNVESGGNDPRVIAQQLLELPPSDIYALSEVDRNDVYEAALNERWPERFGYVRGFSGSMYERPDDRLWIAYDKRRFAVVNSYEMLQGGGIDVYDGRHRAPLVVHLSDYETSQQWLLMHNHLARGNAEFRQQQARGLRDWARLAALPIVAVGDYNFDYEFATERGNRAFDAFLQDGIWSWVRPVELIDTNWFDGDGDDLDDYPGSLLDFSFVAGAAGSWPASSRVIVREGDFPDDHTTSDHRPIELIITPQ